jgi:hypothetical protein
MAIMSGLFAVRHTHAKNNAVTFGFLGGKSHGDVKIGKAPLSGKRFLASPLDHPAPGEVVVVSSAGSGSCRIGCNHRGGRGRCGRSRRCGRRGRSTFNCQRRMKWSTTRWHNGNCPPSLPYLPAGRPTMSTTIQSPSL